MPPSVRKLLSNTPFLILSFLLLAGATVYFVSANRADVRNILFIALGRPDTHAGQWDRWVQRYGGVFDMIAVPARIGIQEKGERATGVLIEKTSTGFHCRTVMSLAGEHAGLVFIVDAAGKEKFFNGLGSRPPSDIWVMMKDNLYADHMKIWYDPDLQALKSGGYLKLMRDIDTKPEQLEWKDVRRMLSEPNY